MKVEIIETVVDKTFDGLNDLIRDKELFEWYKSLIVTTVKYEVEIAEMEKDKEIKELVKVINWIGKSIEKGKITNTEFTTKFVKMVKQARQA